MLTLFLFTNYTINIAHIEGSFTNVIGLPVAQVFEKINEIINQN